MTSNGLKKHLSFNEIKCRVDWKQALVELALAPERSQMYFKQERPLRERIKLLKMILRDEIGSAENWKRSFIGDCKLRELQAAHMHVTLDENPRPHQDPEEEWQKKIGNLKLAFISLRGQYESARRRILELEIPIEFPVLCKPFEKLVARAELAKYILLFEPNFPGDIPDIPLGHKRRGPLDLNPDFNQEPALDLGQVFFDWSKPLPDIGYFVCPGEDGYEKDKPVSSNVVEVKNLYNGPLGLPQKLMESWIQQKKELNEALRSLTSPEMMTHGKVLTDQERAFLKAKEEKRREEEELQRHGRILTPRERAEARQLERLERELAKANLDKLREKQETIKSKIDELKSEKTFPLKEACHSEHVAPKESSSKNKTETLNDMFNTEGLTTKTQLERFNYVLSQRPTIEQIKAKYHLDPDGWKKFRATLNSRLTDCEIKLNKNNGRYEVVPIGE